MKQLQLWKTSFVALLSIVALTFTACVDDDVDNQEPTLELSTESVTFADGATGSETVQIKSNRRWSIAYEDEATQREWMYFTVAGNMVSEGLYEGDGTVTISCSEISEPRQGRLVLTLGNSYGPLFTKYLTVTKGNYVPPTAGPVGKLVDYIIGSERLSGAVGSANAMPLQYTEGTIEAVILANDAAGNNNRKLYVGDNNGLQRSAIVLYDAAFAMANDPVTNYPVGAKVTLNLANANYYAFNNVRQLTDVEVTVKDEREELVIPTLTVDRFKTGEYQAQYVRMNDMTPAANWVGKSWTAPDANQSVILTDATGNELTLYMNRGNYATGFNGLYIAEKSGTIYGVAETYRENAQLIPTSPKDIEAFTATEGGGDEPTPDVPADAIYFNNFDKETATKTYGNSQSSWPYLDQFEGWKNETGSGAAGIEYDTRSTSVRANASGIQDYNGASKLNNITFSGNDSYLTIGKIKLAGTTKLRLIFGSLYNGNNIITWDDAKFSVELSADGTAWSPLSYTRTTAENWSLTQADFTLSKACEELHIRFTSHDTSGASSAIRIDDVTLTAGEGGQEIDLGEGGGEEPEPTPAEAITVNELYLMAEGATGNVVIDAEKDRTLEAIIVTDAANGAYSRNNLMVMAEGATSSKNGILLYSSGKYTDPSNAEFPFKAGDKVRFTLKAGQAKVTNYSGCMEVLCDKADAETWLEAEKIGETSLTPIELTSIDQLADYQAMLVTVKGVASPAEAGTWAGSHTFTVGGQDLTVFVANGATFANDQFKASTTGDLTGYVALYKGNAQLCPRNTTDAAAFVSEGGGEEPEPAPAEGLIASATDVKAGTYAILFLHDDTGKYYYLPNSTAKTTPDGVEIEIVDGKIVGSVPTDLAWTLTGDNSDGFIVSGNNFYLESTDTTKGIKITENSTPQKWIFTDDAEHGMLMQSPTVSTRNLAIFYGTAASWRYYNADNNYKGKLYLLPVESGSTTPGPDQPTDPDQPSTETYDRVSTIEGIVNGMTAYIGGEVGTHGLNLINGMASYGQAFTSKYSYDESAKTLTQEGDYTAIAFTFEQVDGGWNIKCASGEDTGKYLVGTVALDNDKPKQALAFADAPANPWVFENLNDGVVAKTDASNEHGSFESMYMMLAKTASSKFIRAYQGPTPNTNSGDGFQLFKKN